MKANKQQQGFSYGLRFLNTTQNNTYNDVRKRVGQADTEQGLFGQSSHSSFIFHLSDRHAFRFCYILEKQPEGTWFTFYSL